MKFFFRGSANWSLTGTRLFLLIWSVTVACEKRTSELLDIGCKLQMNYDSIQGHWFSPEVRWCREQVKSGVIHFLGTDMHRSDYRPPQITEALKWLDGHIDAQQIWCITYQNALRVIKKETNIIIGRKGKSTYG